MVIRYPTVNRFQMMTRETLRDVDALHLDDVELDQYLDACQAMTTRHGTARQVDASLAERAAADLPQARRPATTDMTDGW